MALDVSTLQRATEGHTLIDDGVTTVIWTGEAHDVTIEYVSHNPEMTYYVSPIWNMRQKGVSLVDENGIMVKNERRDR